MKNGISYDFFVFESIDLNFDGLFMFVDKIINNTVTRLFDELVDILQTTRLCSSIASKVNGVTIQKI